MTKISATGIMLVDDPAPTLRALCKVKNGKISKERYIQEYERLLDRTKSIARQTKDTHFYLLKIFDLIKSLNKDEYVATQLTFDLCKSFDANNEDFKGIIQIAIFNSEKKDFFEDFLNRFNDSKLQQKNLQEFYTPPQLKTLFAWCTYVGLLETDGKDYWKVDFKEKIPDNESFEKCFIETHEQLNQTEIFTVRRFYIDINELRNTVCARLHMRRETFDTFLIDLIESKKHKIRLHGSPPVYSEQELETKSFHFKGKIYHFISIE